ncbi:PREDICTED: T-lymphocyte activation antigen CD80 isoform X2 [Cercocebus atys]|uniref:T-lymphocyte activation antigen CD80 n=2 Tax=Cercopithecinae TaxID=9528 RepID=A0A2K5LZ00_CERAT|nr:PREDICTED: T-lymphocyte activation antigen CD80 [Mandrillus leucophaeus]XP_011923812.1 PREDICTED: T-lymphocyte activation antigen CD80 isoform X2 [Cercocebus atys]
MGHTWRQGISPSKCPYLKFFQLLVLACLSHFCSGVIHVTKEVKEVATLSCGHNVSVEELAQTRIYWQKEKKMVLTMISGDMNIWPEYKNRTIFDITNNLSIVILALRPSDEGTYECVVLKYEKDAFKREHLAEVMLSVKADFPTPSITDFEIPPSNIRRIICSTSGGFPEPHLSWLENGEELNAIDTTVSQDPETELYTVSSKLDFNMTTNHSFVCLIKYGHLRVNQTFNWNTPKQEHFPDNLLPSWAITLISVNGIFVICCLTYCFAPRCRERRRNETLRRESVRPI